MCFCVCRSSAHLLMIAPTTHFRRRLSARLLSRFITAASSQRSAEPFAMTKRETSERTQESIGSQLSMPHTNTASAAFCGRAPRPFSAAAASTNVRAMSVAQRARSPGALSMRVTAAVLSTTMTASRTAGPPAATTSISATHSRRFVESKLHSSEVKVIPISTSSWPVSDR